MSNLSDCISELKERSAFWLAGSDQANTYPPDGLDSEGAQFLTSVRDAALEWWSYMPEADRDDADAAASEQTDACVPVYTHQMWKTFIDLGAYNEDDATDVTDTMTGMASYALHLIAERLFLALVAELIEAREEDELDEDECEGHESLDGAHMGETVYCDGTCK